MKSAGISLLIFLGLVSIACGGGSTSSGNINGTWNATLTDPNNSSGPAFAFRTAFTQTSSSTLNVTTFSFNTENDSCFGTSGSETGSFGLAGNFNGDVSGAFAMTIQSASPSGNTLTLNGTVSNNQITGTWTLTGPGCTGNGTFTMNKM